MNTPSSSAIRTGAEQTERYLPLMKGKRIGMVVNQTSIIGSRHLVDSLKQLGVDVRAIFAPEHGFRGMADAGEHVDDGRDPATGIRVISIYGSKKQPSREDLQDIDLVLFDIQDVGVRFFTYISTLHYVMDACATNGRPLLILDRPNPNGHYVDGPVLDTAFRSFVGMHPVPVVHGLTIGEYVRMINGEGWLGKGKTCQLEVITCQQYTHGSYYELPVKPSPNLPNIRAVLLYPWICFFEGTVVSLGRGTDKQFQVIGAPGYAKGSYAFTPEPKPGAKEPPHKGVLCKGYDLSQLDARDLFKKSKLELHFVMDFFKNYTPKDAFFLKSNFFDKLAGTDQLRKQITSGMTEASIRKSWEPALQAFKVKRNRYLLYPNNVEE